MIWPRKVISESLFHALVGRENNNEEILSREIIHFYSQILARTHLLNSGYESPSDQRIAGKQLVADIARE